MKTEKRKDSRIEVKAKDEEGNILFYFKGCPLYITHIENGFVMSNIPLTTKCTQCNGCGYDDYKGTNGCGLCRKTGQMDLYKEK